jgi:hypothetical protein
MEKQPEIAMQQNHTKWAIGFSTAMQEYFYKQILIS